VFVIQNYTAASFPKIVVADVVVSLNVGAGSGAFVSRNSAANELWVTLQANVSQGTAVRFMLDIG
jgi:hypothetical protein